MKLSRLAVTVAAIALPLAACSDSTTEETTTGATTTTDAPTTDEATTDAATDEPTGGTTTDSGTADGKPTKDEMKDGMSRLLAEMGIDNETLMAAGLTEEQIDGYYQCIVDESYDKISPAFATAIAGVDQSAEIAEEDGAIFNAAVETCAGQLQTGK